MIYPFTGVGWVVLIAAMLLPTLPLGAIVAWLFTSVYGLAIIRRSAEGSKVMPSLTDVGGPVAFILSLLKLLLVTLVSAWPVILAIPQRGYELLNVNNVKLARFKEIFPAPAKTDKIDRAEGSWS